MLDPYYWYSKESKSYQCLNIQIRIGIHICYARCDETSVESMHGGHAPGLCSTEVSRYTKTYARPILVGIQKNQSIFFIN